MGPTPQAPLGDSDDERFMAGFVRRLQALDLRTDPPRSDGRRMLDRLLAFRAELYRTGDASFFDLGLSYAQLRVIEIVARGDGPCGSEIARELNLTRQAVHRIVHQLAAARMLHLDEPEGWGGRRAIRLARTGRYVTEFAVPSHRRWIDALFERYATAEIQRCRTLLDHMRGRLEPLPT